MFRHAFRKSRVLVPADAFYEWVTKDGKQPYLIRLRDGEPMAIGGLLEHWHGFAGDVTTFTILTTNANSLMAKIHDRMPVIIKPEDYPAWIDTNLTDVIKIQAMTLPYPDRSSTVRKMIRRI
jgi:putative SOS response-associated peptidase YedK